MKTPRRLVTLAAGSAMALSAMAADGDALSVAPGPFQPTWASLGQRQNPAWFSEAKFGIWVHWGPQSAAAYGDWYARTMYTEGSKAYKFHLNKYGHPSEFGFKDVINTWKAEKFDAAKLAALYKKAGARYLVAMANHHDNFDNWASTHQPWNSVNMGPKRDIVGELKAAADKEKMRFGVSIHNINTWGWYDPCRDSDTKGPKAGVPYDGHLTKADGKGKWWEGYDPADLYGPVHKGGETGDAPSAAFMTNWFLRTRELIDKYQPDVLEFDLWSPTTVWRQWVRFDDISGPNQVDARMGMSIAQHYYNQQRRWKNGADEGIITLKGLTPERMPGATLVFERDFSSTILARPGQMEDGMGDWHYNGKEGAYMPASEVIATLVESVARNCNLLLNVVLRPDGSVAGDQEATLLRVGQWLAVNGEAIYGSSPYEVMAEGPNRMKSRAQFKEENAPNKLPKYSEADIRFTRKPGAVYAIVMVSPTKELTINSVSRETIKAVTLLGSDEPVKWLQTPTGLVIQPPAKAPGELAVVYKIE
jgi:alpha-L-fucosidase